MEVNYKDEKKQDINSKIIKELFTKSADVEVHPIKMADGNIIIHVLCVDGMVDSSLLGKMILQPLVTNPKFKESKMESEIIDHLLTGLAYSPFVSETNDIEDVFVAAMSGIVPVLFDGEKKAVLFDVRSFDKRSIDEPPDEGVMKGAKDSFIEVLRTNTSLIRRRIKSKHLVFEHFTAGNLSKTDIAVGYLSNIADLNAVKDIINKIKNIDIDNISSPAFIEEYLTENKYSVFPQIMYTERPDRTVANLTEGKIVVIVDGIPFVYLLPCQFVMLMQSPEDYGNHFIIGSFLRLIRYMALLVVLLLPALYISTTTFQNEMLPMELAISIQESKLNLPFSSALEVMGLLIAFEILIEASLRLPKSVGTAMSILGGLVVGQAAVDAGLISSTVVVIVSISGITGFMMPNQDLSSTLRLIRFLLTILASFMGLFGVTIGIIFIITHLCSLDNYNTPYLSPYVDQETASLNDTLLRFPVDHLRTKMSVYGRRKKSGKGGKQ